MNAVLSHVRAPSRKVLAVSGLFALAFLALLATTPSHALDLVAFTGITGPLVSALTQLAGLAQGGEADEGHDEPDETHQRPVLFYLGMAIFGAVGLTIAGAILGAVA